MRTVAVLLAALLAFPSAATAQSALGSAAAPPRLIVAVSVDQFSADLFAEYRALFTHGLKRLQQGAVFPAGYQSHAATETCPGHSTILTGVRPARSGIIANHWIDQSIARPEKLVYCAEDERQSADPGNPLSSAVHLLAPTLGDRLKAADPRTRNVAVAGKDRAALMMGGKTLDQVYWWKGSGFVTLAGRALGPSALAENEALEAEIAAAAPPMDLPAACAPRDRAVSTGPLILGTGRFARAAGDAGGFRVSPSLDAATATLAERLIAELDLGRGPATDVLAVGLSATDYVGHTTGTGGAEMCLQMLALDRAIGKLLDSLDRRGLDYLVVLTADHGGLDVAERLRQQAFPQAGRIDPALATGTLAKAIAQRLKIALPRPVILADGPAGDIYLDRGLSPRQRQAVLAELKALERHPQVAAVFTAAELTRVPSPTGSPETWSLAQRARASFYPGRSGDAVLLLQPLIVPLAAAGSGAVATHGSPWDYDRRVPILFWRRGMAGFEQPHAVETVDIAPTLAAVLGLAVPAGSFDGRCLDLDAGAGDTCASR